MYAVRVQIFILVSKFFQHLFLFIFRQSFLILAGRRCGSRSIVQRGGPRGRMELFKGRRRQGRREMVVLWLMRWRSGQDESVRCGAYDGG